MSLGTGLRFRVAALRNVFPAASLQGFTAWRNLWICSQRNHARRPVGSMGGRNLPLASLGSGFIPTSGTSLQREPLECHGEMAIACGARRIQGARPVSLSTAATGFFGIGRGGDGSGNRKLTLQDVAELIQKKACHRMVVMAGAGISTPSGIPDFRSPGSGLYSNLQQYNIPYPEAIFEIAYFFHNPKPFFTLAKELYPGNYRPNYSHYFLRLLHDKGLLLRLYTQNIDGLERVAGIPLDKLVEAHGTFATATCTVCRRSYPGEDFRGDVMADKIPHCPVCTGLIKPDIVFFGEELPHRFFLHVTDFPMADVLFIIGTSLEVQPFASLADAVRSSIPRVLINRDLVGPFAYQPQYNDVALLGDVISGVETFVELMGWKEEMQELIRRETEKLDAKDN
ncbi:NAD-dependent protein deacetylase sirtuin-3, mitochondrial isoform X1 [Dermochelys coriacea]|uniref:NAD-dependent protein deacetylase sirtuin-3, mitochondrial isoform X1 n=1 Tax=Dermochelys coriacea TaxID=27794 RepID=UPI001CA967F1|nr:NAD-dependent protein deacetylase sirtuin-3, mitochondrial isoform X1 [Dermochelys coriacea]